ncbi:MAG: Uma2 family endonuclease [Gemmataceae bacterium]
MIAYPAKPDWYIVSDEEDGVHYPSSDGKPMGETGFHVNALMFLIDSMEVFFGDRPDVLVTATQFWYREKGNPKAGWAPDMMIVPGVGCEPRRSYRTWVEGGAIPAAIIELTSNDTVRRDLKVKYETYESLGVHEYFVFDPEGRALRPSLQGFRLSEGRYRRIDPVRGRVDSQLGFGLRREDRRIRLLDAKTGSMVLTPGEWLDQCRWWSERGRSRTDRLKAQGDRLDRLFAERREGQP